MPMSKPSSKLSRSLSKILRSLFRSKPNSNSSIFLTRDQPKDGFYVFYEVGSLSTIPEVPEADFGAGLSPEISSLVKKTASERAKDFVASEGANKKLRVEMVKAMAGDLGRRRGLFSLELCRQQISHRFDGRNRRHLRFS
ncbi:hypothetical protein SDJN03_24724, partial [Cucurbita argyrosperma subsp. sororia]